MTGRKLTAALGAVALGGMMMVADMTEAQGVSFDAATWTSVPKGKAEDSEPRRALIEPAIAILPAGTSRDQVRTTLGEPDRDNKTEWVYYAGTTSFGGEYTFLVVTFDGDAVTSVERVASESYADPG